MALTTEGPIYGWLLSPKMPEIHAGDGIVPATKASVLLKTRENIALLYGTIILVSISAISILPSPPQKRMTTPLESIIRILRY